MEVKTKFIRHCYCHTTDTEVISNIFRYIDEFFEYIISFQVSRTKTHLKLNRIVINYLHLFFFTCTFEHQDLEVMFAKLPENILSNLSVFLFLALPTCFCYILKFNIIIECINLQEMNFQQNIDCASKPT